MRWTHNEPRCIQAAAGLCFGYAKRSVICADSEYDLTSAWPSRALSHVNTTLSAAAFRPSRHTWLSRHRDPAPVGVSYIVPVESSLLQCSGIDELPKEGTFRFPPALVNNGGSSLMLPFFRACVNFFRDILRPRCRPRASGIPRARRCVTPLPIFEAQLQQASALAQILAKRWASLTSSLRRAYKALSFF
jgi:hypothetical protein